MIDEKGNVLSTLDADMIGMLRYVLLLALLTFCTVSMAGAFYTGFTSTGHWMFTSMTGFFPPHRGYSAYVVTPLVFLTPWPELWCQALFALLLGGARASWVGVIAGWGWRHRGWRPVALASILCVLAVVGGNRMKPRGATGDTVRVQIWKAALHEARKHPGGVGERGFAAAVDGNLATKAHSDVLQLLVIHGWAALALALWVWGAAFWMLPGGPAKAAVVALTVQSVVDNRLHHWACALVYFVVWVLAATEDRPA